MTENEAIKKIRDKACNDRCAEIHCDDSCMYRECKCAFQMAIQALEEIQQYRAIGTVEEFKALKEKAEPKKGIPYSSAKNHKFVECPNCHKDMDLYYDFCQHCGQAVDWGKTKT